MTGEAVVQRALVLLNYTTPAGETDNRLNVEQIRRALPCLNQVLADLQFIQRTALKEVECLNDELPLTDDVAIRVAVPGMAMYLAQGEGDADAYDRWALEYSQRRNSLCRPAARIEDAIPYPSM